jgi:hypothetical protein
MPPSARATSNPSPLAFHKSIIDNGRIVASSFIRLLRQQPILHQSTSRPCRHQPTTLPDDPQVTNHWDVPLNVLKLSWKSPTSSNAMRQKNNYTTANAALSIVPKELRSQHLLLRQLSRLLPLFPPNVLQEPRLNAVLPRGGRHPSNSPLLMSPPNPPNLLQQQTCWTGKQS